MESDKRRLLRAVAQDAVGLIGITAPNTVTTLLGIGIRRARQLWADESVIFGPDGRPIRPLVGRSGLLIEPEQLRALPGFDAGASTRIRGRFDRSDPWTRERLEPTDKIALLVQNAESGLLIPGRVGESFSLTLPRNEYRLSAFALNSDALESSEADPVWALGGGVSIPVRRTILGRSRIDLQQRPGWNAPTPSTTEHEVQSIVQAREQLRIPELKPTKPQTHDSTRCVAAVEARQCRSFPMKREVLCARHIAVALSEKELEFVVPAEDARLVCDADPDKKREPCKLDAVVMGEGGWLYCHDHMDLIEPELERCQALTLQGERCRRLVSQDRWYLCSSHGDASFVVQHYASPLVTFN